MFIENYKLRDLKLCNAFYETSGTITFLRKYLSILSVERLISVNKKQRELSYVEAPDLCLTP